MQRYAILLCKYKLFVDLILALCVYLIGRQMAELDAKAPLTPWFRLIAKHRLALWWDNLHQLKKIQDHENIQRF